MAFFQCPVHCCGHFAFCFGCTILLALFCYLARYLFLQAADRFTRPTKQFDFLVHREFGLLFNPVYTFAFGSLSPLLLLYTSTAITAMQKIDIESNTEIKRALPLYRLPGRCESLSLSSGLS